MPNPRRMTLAFVLSVAGFLVSAGLTGCGVPPPSGPPQSPAATDAPGVNADAPDHSVAIRDLFLPDPGAAGYLAGGTAPVALQVWNNTNQDVSLTGATASSVPAMLISPGQTPAPTGATGFDLRIPAGGSVDLTQQAGRFLLIRCVPVTLASGTSVPMTFQFSNGTKISIDAPVGVVASIPATVPAVASKAC
jgi:hypothetical protein